MMLVIYYLVLPILAGALLIKFIKSRALAVPQELLANFAAHPIAKKMFRSVRMSLGQGERTVVLLGDYETHSDAVDAIYAAKEQAQKDGAAATFLVLNDKMETLEQIDS